MNRKQSLFSAIEMSECAKMNSKPAEQLDGTLVWLVLKNQTLISLVPRLICVDLDIEEDLRQFDVEFNDLGDASIWFGDDESGHWKVVGAFEWVSPTLELHADHYPVSYEISIPDLIEMIKKRLPRQVRLAELPG